MTEIRDHVGEVSQCTGVTPTACSTVLTTPASLLSIHAQVDDDTISGNSHGTRNSARSVAESRKFRWKNTASAIPMENWKASETRMKTAVCVNAGRNVGSAKTLR